MNDYETNENRFIGQYTYDKSNNVTRVRTVADGTQLTVSYAYTKENIPLSTTMNSSVAYSYSYDKLNRMTKTALSTPNEVELNYTYLYSARNAENETLYKTTQLHTEDLALQTYRYTYDKLGNITEIEEKAAGETSYSSKVSYTYDPLGQLTRENNVDLNKTIVYNYNEGGNITSKVEYPYTTGTVGEETNTITYGYTNKNGYWGDKLRSITVGETTQSFTYDDIGNPLTYRDGMSFTWQGRQMTSANVNGTEISYKYDADGLRSYKKVGSTVHEYEYLGGKLVYEKRGDVQLRFRYDAMGNLAGITRINPDGAVYKVYVICNSRGDVEQLRKADGTVFATYKYDTWGNMIGVYNASGAAITSETNLANQNPIRYRGYYYDAETGLYYLQSRYYEHRGRFYVFK